MKAPILKTTSLFVSLLLAHSVAANYEIKQHSINSGGGTLQGQSFHLQGTIGQAVAEPLSQGGTYQLSPGFWSPNQTANDDVIFITGFEP
ncbi:hypothetical protein [Marinicella meishanensis]|uniref:hypothetical protein n=1 Tax=Marinicella meishanensis TaxID=2873263 RepID=UPI001CBEB189|nr:hypothetical protein [Marinicella sp. NBU2979]